jgi:Barstar (barnase inhibitor)
VTIGARPPLEWQSSAALFDSLATLLRFPGYFGHNGNALDECLHDLAWLPDGEVVIEHADLPLADNEDDLRTYLSILRSAVVGASYGDTGAFIVTFPADAASRVEEQQVAGR